MKKLIGILLLSIIFHGLSYGRVESDRVKSAQDYESTHVTLRQGLPHNFVDCIHVDSRGFVWMGLAGGGLVRYDGYDFEQFSPNNPHRCILGNMVMSMCETPDGLLWVGSDCGIDVVDIATATPISRADMNLPDLRVRIVGICQDSRGRIWACTVDRVFCMTLDANGKVSRTHQRAFTSSAPLNSLCIRDIDADGSVYVCQGGKIAQLRCTDSGIDAPLPLSHLADHLRVFDMLVHNGDLWVGTDIGLFRCDRQGNRVKRVYHYNDATSGLLHNWVNALVEDADGCMFAGTLNGLNAYDDVADAFVKVDFHGSDKAKTIAGDFVNSIACSGDNLWIGTEGDGAVLMTPKRLNAQYYRFGATDKDAPSKPVNSIYEDEGLTLWVGSVEGGLAYRPKGKADFVTLNTENSPLPHNSVSAITGDHDGGLWVGTWGEGVIVLDRKDPSKELLRPALYSDNGERSVFIGALQYDPYNDAVWIGTRDGIFYCDVATGEIIRPLDNSDSPYGMVGSAIDNQKHLWMGGFDGLYDIDLTSRSGDKWRHRKLDCKLDRPGSGIRDHVTSIMLASDGSLLVGSSVYGAYRRTVDDNGNEHFVNVTMNDGLPNNSVMGMLEDFQGNLWMSTYNGLGFYDSSRKVWSIVPDLQMPHSSQFYWNAYEFTSDGHLLFGSTDGMIDIDTSTLSEREEKYKVNFTNALVDGELACIQGGAGADAATLAYKQNARTLQVHFSALDYAHNPTYVYFYRLKGFDRDWMRLPQGRHDVTYTNLSPGHYKLEVAYARNGALKSMEGSILALEVAPMFYNQWWFRLICVMLAAGAVVLLYRRKTSNLALQRIELERKVEERTSELTRQKQALEQRNLQVQEMTVDRLSFFTNITHEFRTPITLILGPLSQAMQETDNPKVTKHLKLVRRNAMYLLTLVNQLMDFRKIESGKVEILRLPGDFGQFLADTVEPFMSLAQDRNIKIDTICSLPPGDINFDKEAMRKLLHNFIANSLKYTPDGGSVTVRAAVLPERCHESLGTDYRKLYISVADTGDGLNPDDLDKVFDRFYQGKSNIKYPTSAGSSGIGLYLCKSIVEAYGGELTAKNAHGGGAVFRVLLPIPATVPVDGDVEAVAQPLAETSHVEGEGNETLLIVEDNHDMLQYLGSFFEPHFAVLKAHNGKEALELLAKEKVDLILSDLMMPEMDGIELTRAVKRNLAMSHIPIVLLTAKSSEMTQLESFKEGVDAFIVKPFNPQLLLSRISAIVRNKKRYQRAFAINYKIDDMSATEETRDQKFMRQVMDVVNANYRNSYFEVGDFAEELGVSRSFLNKKLQALIGQSASQLVKNYRMKLAYDKIVANRATRSYTISEIAYDVGFNDSKYFAKCFAKEYGVTPSGLLNDEAPKKN